MAGPFEIVEGKNRYNAVYRYSWRTSTYALPQTVWQKLDKMCAGEWGYHFIPNERMNYNDPNWYENQTLYLTFEQESDLLQAKLSLELK